MYFLLSMFFEENKFIIEGEHFFISQNTYEFSTTKQSFPIDYSKLP